MKSLCVNSHRTPESYSNLPAELTKNERLVLDLLEKAAVETAGGELDPKYIAKELNLQHPSIAVALARLDFRGLVERGSQKVESNDRYGAIPKNKLGRKKKPFYMWRIRTQLTLEL